MYIYVWFPPRSVAGRTIDCRVLQVAQPLTPQPSTPDAITASLTPQPYTPHQPDTLIPSSAWHPSVLELGRS